MRNWLSHWPQSPRSERSRPEELANLKFDVSGILRSTTGLELWAMTLCPNLWFAVTTFLLLACSFRAFCFWRFSFVELFLFLPNAEDDEFFFRCLQSWNPSRVVLPLILSAALGKIFFFCNFTFGGLFPLNRKNLVTSSRCLFSLFLFFDFFGTCYLQFSVEARWRYFADGERPETHSVSCHVSPFPRR